MEHDSYKTSHPDSSDVPSDADIDQTLPEEEQHLYASLQLHRGKEPESIKGVHHELMKLAWNPNKIETILESENDTLIYMFYLICVSRAVGKRKWNVYCKTKLLHEFVTPADEAFAMLVLENNVAKWMSEIRFANTQIPEERFKALYTQGKTGRKWNSCGTKRYIYLVKICKAYRLDDDKKQRYRHIERLVLQREQSTLGRHLLHGTSGDNDSDDDVDNEEDEEEMERELLAMANGE